MKWTAGLVSGGLFLWGCLGLSGCTSSDGLTPVSGVEGDVIIASAWPDTIQALVLAVLTGQDMDKLADELIAYSDPILQGETKASFFIQLPPPGPYLLVPVGITVDPGFLIANLDSILAAPKLPLVPLLDPHLPTGGIQSLVIHQQTISNPPENPWRISFP